MRLLSAALLGAAAALPALAHAATPTIPDPADAAASVPAITAQSAFAAYEPYRDGENPAWQQLNRAVMEKTAKNGIKHDAMAGMPSGGSNPGNAIHKEAAK